MIDAYPTLKNEILHLTDIYEGDYTLRWDESSDFPFEILCRNFNPEQLRNLDAQLTHAYNQALEKLIPQS